MDSYPSRNSKIKTEYSEEDGTEVIYATYNKKEFIHGFSIYLGKNYLYHMQKLMKSSL